MADLRAGEGVDFYDLRIGTGDAVRAERVVFEKHVVRFRGARDELHVARKLPLADAVEVGLALRHAERWVDHIRHRAAGPGTVCGADAVVEEARVKQRGTSQGKSQGLHAESGGNRHRFEEVSRKLHTRLAQSKIRQRLGTCKIPSSAQDRLYSATKRLLLWKHLENMPARPMTNWAYAFSWSVWFRYLDSGDGFYSPAARCQQTHGEGEEDAERWLRDSYRSAVGAACSVLPDDVGVWKINTGK
jgi:hypothetical protein